MSRYRNYNRGRRAPAPPDMRIEPAKGATYGATEESPFAVYEYDEYPSSSVLAGQERRRWVDSGQLEELKAKYPKADVSQCSGYRPPSLNHLSDQEDR